ncbi:MgtC/SapB family protein [Rhodopirellula sp. MGV]|uniref:MgtC/SapB family protein n=1 Tax=Rhodopirellula sp. MGV TaxID=2023130 RepID=UPI000B977704|nr:MgtC/SapB family protein [Rhodopirellula sp. MGV]OYP28275.1 MgtC/SapB transporter [Rhodopirellula sp. MGV]PNY38847.1 MgtC/SapB family protein [Rhodopirellula baltica]
MGYQQSSNVDVTAAWVFTIDYQNLLTVLIAGALGAILGLEREIASKPAGIRTHILVASGSALMMILGQDIISEFRQESSPPELRSDPIRVLQAIVVGISFLGAGTIVHDRKEGVEGLTTAATIYVTAGIGVAAAVDRVYFAFLVTAVVVMVLTAVGFVERSVHRWQQNRRR